MMSNATQGIFTHSCTKKMLEMNLRIQETFVFRTQIGGVGGLQNSAIP